MDQNKGAVACFRTFKTVMALEGNAAHIHRRLLTVRNILGAAVQILLNSLQIISQLRGPVLSSVQLAQNPDGLIGIFIQGGIASGNHHNRSSGLCLQIVGIYRGRLAHDNHLGAQIDDFFGIGFAVGADHGQILELIEVYILVKAGHVGLCFIIFYTHNQVGGTYIAAVTQRTHTHTDNGLHLFRNFHLTAQGIRNHPAGLPWTGVRRTSCKSSQHHTANQK